MAEDRVEKSDAAWREQLTPEQYAVCRNKGTEAPFSGEYCGAKAEGVYACCCCGAELFESTTKFDSGTGWPSYFQPVRPEAVREVEDLSHGMRRVEVVCARCDCHLGHVFPDGPPPTGRRYCINSISLTLRPKA